MRTLSPVLLLLFVGCTTRLTPPPNTSDTSQPPRTVAAPETNTQPSQSEPVSHASSEVEAPEKAASAEPSTIVETPARSEVWSGRTFVDASGLHSTEAEFVRAENNRVYLRKQNGQIVNLLLSQLSQADKDFVFAEVLRRREQAKLAEARAKLAEAKAKLATAERERTEARIAVDAEKRAARTPVFEPAPRAKLNFSSDDSDRIWVEGYTRKDGTKVKGYWRKK